MTTVVVDKQCSIGLRLDPLDTLFFRDGRPFGAADRGQSGLCQPQTLAGALRTALLHACGPSVLQEFTNKIRAGADAKSVLRACGVPHWAIETRFRGPWLALAPKDDAEILPLLPVPWTLARDAETGTWFRAMPEETSLPGWRPPQSGMDGMCPLWRREGPDAKSPGGFLTPDGIHQFLEGGLPEDQHWFRNDALFGWDSRTGIGIDADRLTARVGAIYGINLLALRPTVQRDGRTFSVCLYAEVIPPEDATQEVSEALTGAIPLGGEKRLVSCRPDKAFRWQEAMETDRSMWLLASPGIFGDDAGRRGWRSSAIPAAQLRAAGSGPPQAVSGWDIARNRPKPTRFAVPAGSVYFVEGAFTPPHASLCTDKEDVAQGWGFALRGVWNNGET